MKNTQTKNKEMDDPNVPRKSYKNVSELLAALDAKLGRLENTAQSELNEALFWLRQFADVERIWLGPGGKR